MLKVVEKTIEVGRDLEEVARGADLVPRGLGRSIERGLQIGRYYRTGQLLRRLWRSLSPGKKWGVGVADPWRGKAVFRETEREELAKLARLRTVRTIVDSALVREGLERGEFTLLGEQRSLGEPIDWRVNVSPRPSRLWRFQLHYQEYLLDVAAGSDWCGDATWATIWDVIEDWIDQNPVAAADPQGDAWHPYCVSRRLPVWLMLAAVGLPTGERGERVLASCAQQAEFLSQHLETDLGGNHLLENVHALVLAGCLLETERGTGRIEGTDLGEGDSPLLLRGLRKRGQSPGLRNRDQSPGRDAWLAKAERVLRRELPRQLLAHGEHFERSPMYHAQVLGNLLQMVVVSRDLAGPFSEFCRDAAERMWRFLTAILHPDGEIPLFGDSCFGESFSVAELGALTELAGIDGGGEVPRGPATCGPYWVWRHNDDAWIFDGGRLAADALPAHGHCDLLGFEASIAGERWFIDSGLFDYNESSMRRYCRSSIAHNVVTVDDRDQCDIWSAFRMGYRGWPSSFVTGSDGTFHWAAARHNAYRRMGIVLAERWLAASEKDVWACFDHLRSTLRHRATGRLHLAPDVRIEPVGDAQFRLQLGQTVRLLTFYGAERVSLAGGWYCERFGSRRRTRVIEYVSDARQRVTMGWLMAPEQQLVSTVILDEGPDTLLVVECVDAQGPRIEWRFAGEGSSPSSEKSHEMGLRTIE